jgi:hypothetical protein
LFDLFFGLYLKEFGVTILCLLPRRLWSSPEAAANGDLNARLLSGIARDSRIGQVRRDALCILGAYGSSAALYAHSRGLGYFAAMLLGRAFVVSLHDNAYHYRTDPALVLHARNLRAPRLLSLLLLNFNYHGIHHLAPGLPWFRLPAEFARRKASTVGDIIGATLAQLNGPFPLDAGPAPAAEPLDADVPSFTAEWKREA